MLKELDFETFVERCGTGASVPVYREFLADMETPVSVLNKFKDDPEVFLLESVEGSERWARYSFLGVNPYAVLMELPDKVVLQEKENGVTELPGSDGLTELKKILGMHKLSPSPELPPMVGGAIGYIAYLRICLAAGFLRRCHEEGGGDPCPFEFRGFPSVDRRGGENDDETVPSGNDL